MQFNLSKFLVALVITAACANAATITERGADSSQALLARVWVNPDRGGDQLNIQPTSPLSGCVNLVSPFAKSISSLEVFNGVTCSFFVNATCRGDSFTVSNLFVKDLTGTDYNDLISSYSCSEL